MRLFFKTAGPGSVPLFCLLVQLYSHWRFSAFQRSCLSATSIPFVIGARRVIRRETKDADTSGSAAREDRGPIYSGTNNSSSASTTTAQDPQQATPSVASKTPDKNATALHTTRDRHTEIAAGRVVTDLPTVANTPTSSSTPKALHEGNVTGEAVKLVDSPGSLLPRNFSTGESLFLADGDVDYVQPPQEDSQSTAAKGPGPLVAEVRGEEPGADQTPRPHEPGANARPSRRNITGPNSNKMLRVEAGAGGGEGNGRAIEASIASSSDDHYSVKQQDEDRTDPVPQTGAEGASRGTRQEGGIAPPSAVRPPGAEQNLTITTHIPEQQQLASDSTVPKAARSRDREAAKAPSSRNTKKQLQSSSLQTRSATAVTRNERHNPIIPIQHLHSKRRLRHASTTKSPAALALREEDNNVKIQLRGAIASAQRPTSSSFGTAGADDGRSAAKEEAAALVSRSGAGRQHQESASTTDTATSDIPGHDEDKSRHPQIRSARKAGPGRVRNDLEKPRMSADVSRIDSKRTPPLSSAAPTTEVEAPETRRRDGATAAPTDAKKQSRFVSPPAAFSTTSSTGKESHNFRPAPLHQLYSKRRRQNASRAMSPAALGGDEEDGRGSVSSVPAAHDSLSSKHKQLHDHFLSFQQEQEEEPHNFQNSAERVGVGIQPEDLYLYDTNTTSSAAASVRDIFQQERLHRGFQSSAGAEQTQPQGPPSGSADPDAGGAGSYLQTTKNYNAECETDNLESHPQPTYGNCVYDPCHRVDGWGEWNEWAPASWAAESGPNACGLGQVERQRKKVRNGDRDCENAWGSCGGDGWGNHRHNLHYNEYRVCTYPPCDCEVGSWNEWGRCDAACGIGTQTRKRTQTKQPTSEGLSCAETKDVNGVAYNILTQKRACQICESGEWKCEPDEQKCSKTCCSLLDSKRNTNQYDDNRSCQTYAKTETSGKCKWGYGDPDGTSTLTDTTETCADAKYYTTALSSNTDSVKQQHCSSKCTDGTSGTCNCAKIAICHEKCQDANEGAPSGGFCFDNSSPSAGWYYPSNKASDDDECDSPICGRIGETTTANNVENDCSKNCCSATAQCSSTEAPGGNQHCRNLKDPANQSLDLGKAYNRDNEAKFCKLQNCDTSSEPDQSTCCKLRECQCTSPGGKTPATGAACPAESNEFCTEVDYGYHLVHDAAAGTQEAVQNQCTCEGGDPAVGPDTDNPEDTCFDHGYIQCKSTGCYENHEFEPIERICLWVDPPEIMEANVTNDSNETNETDKTAAPASSGLLATILVGIVLFFVLFCCGSEAEELIEVEEAL
ncbi:unnamed protein product [Amoebophrya sp. A120]|nr:unnamed protein product [Amoebophrya sp. A120]|eukprot:GSA120T00020331001.1